MQVPLRLAGSLLALWAALSLAAGEPGASSSALEEVARRALRDSNASGFIQVADVASGRVLVHVSAPAAGEPAHGLALDSPVKPLSVIKVFVAALWLEQGFGRTVVDCAASATRPRRRMRVEDVMVSGCDSAGATMAVLLRRKLGGVEVVRELRRYGLQDLTVRPDASDAEWGSVLSLGEAEVTATPRQVSGFLAALGRGGGGLVTARTAQRLLSALHGVVARGTAVAIKDVLAGTGWSLGGKTGTGPGQCGDLCDGWFAGLLSDPRGARYVVLVFLRGKGPGGGLAARTAGVLAEQLAMDK